MGALSGDFGAVREMIAECEKLSSGAADRIAQRALPKIDAATDAHFAAESDPYGSPWAPLKKGTSERGGVPVSTLRGEVAITAEGVTITAETTTAPMSMRHTGTSRMVARPCLPDEARGIPAPWVAALEEAATEELAGAGAQKEG